MVALAEAREFLRIVEDQGPLESAERQFRVVREHRDADPPRKHPDREAWCYIGHQAFKQVEDVRKMTRPSVHLETSIVGYATARQSRDLVIAGRQQITRDWFTSRARAFEIFISQLVVNEISGGDEEALKERLTFLQGIPLLGITGTAVDLAERLLASNALPRNAAEDALHIGVAAVHGMEFLLTWNCKHIANATMRPSIEQACREAGCEPPLICTPEELTYEGPIQG